MWSRNMTRTVTWTLVSAALLSTLCLGCSRMFAEAKGTGGASGRVSDSDESRNLSIYASMEVDDITIANGVNAPSEMPAMMRSDLIAVTARRGLGNGDNPKLRLSGEIIHYEDGSKLDAVIGPFEEVVLRARLIDVQSGAIVQETNLIGRSKASTSSGVESLSEGVGKALDTWLDNGGIRES